MRIAIIGAGAAGCFCAINLKRRLPQAEVTVFEKASRPLAKVAVTGGGRCNLTNSFRDVKSLKSVYPRGAQLMKRALAAFSRHDVMRWFEEEGVKLVVQPDQCVFPASQNAMEIVGTLTRLINELGIRLVLNHRIDSLSRLMEEYDRVVVTTGGAPKVAGLSFLDVPDLKLVAPVPSLFTFNVADNALRELTGTMVEDVCCKLAGTKIQAEGPLLVTHRGLSGPAILKLSAHGARLLAERNYEADVCINWMGGMPPDEAADLLRQYRAAHPQKRLTHIYPRNLNRRLWNYLLQKAGLSPEKRWAETGDKQINRLAGTLTAHIHRIAGRDTYKEEFVTCGGVAIDNINMNTLEAKQHPGLYFAGEVLDVDAVTGGFNLQAAWSMGHMVASRI